MITVTKLDRFGAEVHKDGKAVQVVPYHQAVQMGLHPGKWQAVPDESGHLIERRGDWAVVRVGRQRLRVRSFCYDIFSRVTGIIIPRGQSRRYRLVRVEA